MVVTIVRVEDLRTAALVSYGGEQSCPCPGQTVGGTVLFFIGGHSIRQLLRRLPFQQDVIITLRVVVERGVAILGFDAATTVSACVARTASTLGVILTHAIDLTHVAGQVTLSSRLLNTRGVSLLLGYCPVHELAGVDSICQGIGKCARAVHRWHHARAQYPEGEKGQQRLLYGDGVCHYHQCKHYEYEDYDQQ